MKYSISKYYLFANFIATTLLATFVMASHTFLSNQRERDLDQQLQSKLNQLSLKTIDNVQQAVERLRVVSSIVAFSQKPSQTDFETYIKEYMGSGSSWEIVEWQPIVKAHEREAFEQFYGDFFMWEPDDNGKPVAAQEREEHVPVLFMVAADNAINTTGLDLAWSKQRMASKLRSRDEAKAQVSSLFNVVLSPDNQFHPVGFAITLPVYQNGMYPKDITSRRKMIKGYLASVYTLNGLLLKQLEEISQPGIAIEIQDSESDEVIFRRPHPMDKQGFTPLKSYQSNLAVYGRNWEITLATGPAYRQNQPSVFWMYIPYGFFVFGLLLLALVNLLYLSNRKLANSEQQLHQALKKVKESEQYYAKLSRVDPLTELLNRRTFFEKFDFEIARARRYQQPISLLILDIDNFKKINDLYGHPVGDKVLKQFADTCRSISRETDVIGRLGGEEFVFLLVNTNKQDAAFIAQRLRKTIEQTHLDIELGGQQIGVTVSVGMTSLLADDTADSFMSRADKLLYQAKNAGRNCIRVD